LGNGIGATGGIDKGHDDRAGNGVNTGGGRAWIPSGAPDPGLEGMDSLGQIDRHHIGWRFRAGLTAVQGVADRQARPGSADDDVLGRCIGPGGRIEAGGLSLAGDSVMGGGNGTGRPACEPGPGFDGGAGVDGDGTSVERAAERGLGAVQGVINLGARDEARDAHRLRLDIVSIRRIEDGVCELMDRGPGVDLIEVVRPAANHGIKLGRENVVYRDDFLSAVVPHLETDGLIIAVGEDLDQAAGLVGIDRHGRLASQLFGSLHIHKSA